MRVTEPKKPEERVTSWPQLVARVPPEVHLAVRRRALEEGRSVAELVEAVLRAYVTQAEVIPPAKKAKKA